MPGMDGTGPLGYGARTGRGIGRCSEAAADASGYGRGFGLGLGRGRGFCRFAAMDSRAALSAQRALLRERLAAVEKRLLEP